MIKSKAEVDKELMYRKIMPTASKEREEEEEDGERASILKPTAAGMADAVRRPAIPVPVSEEQEMNLVNLMEELVISRLDATILRFNYCKCNKCRKDVAALALNRLKPRYVVMHNDDKEFRRKTEEQYGLEVTEALVQAILQVKKSPRH